MHWGCFGIFHNTVTYGTLTAMLQLVNQVQTPFSGFSAIISQYYSVIASAERLIELENLPEEHGEETDGMKLYADFQRIRFDQVSFTYGRNIVLTDVSFSVGYGSG